MASEYQLGWRTRHSTIVINNILYCWGGDQDDLPEVHDNEEKRKITSSIDLFHLLTFTWERRSTTGTPPVRVRGYACTNIGNNIFYYGGNYKPDDCYHNNLYELNSLNNNWREVVNSTPDNVPMKKMNCGMISFKINGKYNLLVLGGYGPVPVTIHSHSQYIPDPNKPNRCITNEAHIMCVTTSPGQWIVPVITGTRPPPCGGFTMHTLHNNKGVMFGGETIDETGVHHVDDLYTFSCTHNTIDFQKVVKSTVNWPKKRTAHASTIINTISNKVVTSHLIISGGLDDDLQTLNDLWIIQLSSFICYKINLPESVIKRYSHSMATYEISNGHVWITVTGGCSVLNKSDNTGFVITGSDVTFIIELEYINEEWIMKHVWNNEQLMNNKNEILGTLVTDLIGLIKSPFTTPQQLETERILENKIFEKESELLKLSVEMGKKSDEITHLKTREVSLIDKSDTLEKEVGFLKDETQAYKKMAITTRQELKIERKMSLIKSQDLDFSRKQLHHFSEKLKLSSTLSPDEEDLGTMERSMDYQKPQETEIVEEKQSKPVDEYKSVISDKTLIALEENESLQKIVISKNEQVEELHSMLEMKEERMNELESQIEDKKKILLEELESLQTTVVNKTTQMETKLKSLNLQMEEFKKIEELRISSSHDSEVIKYQRDAAVQFSYMVPVTDHLDGVHVAGETLFLIQGDKPQSLNWEEYGFRLHFPQGAISPSDTCEVVVKALVGGKFQFPQGTELVSAVYAISFAKEFLQPVKLDIQHCVSLENEQQIKYLSFVKASLKQAIPSYKFERIDGGQFSTESFYGSITRPQFCLIGIVLYLFTLPVTLSDSTENTLLVVKLVRKRNSEELDEQCSYKRQRIDVDEDEYSDTTTNTVQSEDTNTSTEDTTTSTVQSEDTTTSTVQSEDTTTSTVQSEDTTTSIVQSEDTTTSILQLEDNDIAELNDNDIVEEEAKKRPNDDFEEVPSAKRKSESYNEGNQASRFPSHDNDPAFSNIQTDTSSSNLDYGESLSRNDKAAYKEPHDYTLQDTGGSTCSLVYTGQIGYLKEEINGWTMKFFVVKNINVFFKYAEKRNFSVDCDDIVRFQFQDHVDGYVDLDLSEPQETPHKGWTITPRKEPLRIRKRDADLFGSDDHPIPSSCLITVFAEQAEDTEKHLSYAISLKGVDSDAQKIYIDRFLEKETVVSNVFDAGHSAIKPDSNTDTNRSTVDTIQVIRCIKELMRTYHPDLSELFEGLLKTVSSEMYAVGLIPHAVEKNPTFDAIMSFFLSGFAFKDELEEIEEHCVKFLNVFYKIGGPFVYAANKIKRSIQKTVIDKQGVQLNI